MGPAVLLVHAPAGAFGWLLADARPTLVKGIVAVEPFGPPFRDESSAKNVPDRRWGLTLTPLTYDPPVTEDHPLAFEQQMPAGSELQAGWLQKGTPRSLTHLRGIPTVVVTGEASYHAGYDHCTVAYLIQAGVAVEHLRLADHGILGNGHMMMLERNSLEIAALLNQWLIRNVA